MVYLHCLTFDGTDRLTFFWSIFETVDFVIKIEKINKVVDNLNLISPGYAGTKLSSHLKTKQ